MLNYHFRLKKQTQIRAKQARQLFLNLEIVRGTFSKVEIEDTFFFKDDSEDLVLYRNPFLVDFILSNF